MASFSKEILEITLQTYDDVVSLYKLITKLSHKLGLAEPNVEGEFHFTLDKITCICDSYDEFIENAYGVENFHYISIHFRIMDGDTTVIYIYSLGKNPVSVSADSRIMLENFSTELDEILLSAHNPTNIVTQTIIDSVVINGDKNTVANNNSSVELETERAKSTAKSFWMGILQNITSNFLWYLLTLLAGVLITYFAIR